MDEIVRRDDGTIEGVAVPKFTVPPEMDLLDILAALYDLWMSESDRRLGRANRHALFSPPQLLSATEASMLAACAGELRDVVLEYGRRQEASQDCMQACDWECELGLHHCVWAHLPNHIPGWHKQEDCPHGTGPG